MPGAALVLMLELWARDTVQRYSAEIQCGEHWVRGPARGPAAEACVNMCVCACACVCVCVCACGLRQHLLQKHEACQQAECSHQAQAQHAHALESELADAKERADTLGRQLAASEAHCQQLQLNLAQQVRGCRGGRAFCVYSGRACTCVCLCVRVQVRMRLSDSARSWSACLPVCVRAYFSSCALMVCVPSLPCSA